MQGQRRPPGLRPAGAEPPDSGLLTVRTKPPIIDGPHRTGMSTSAAGNDLTDKQRDALRVAFHNGYFEQPRGVSATELATKFDLSRTTMTQHMRTAQRKLFGQLFDQ